ncbi:hypothetical protein BCR39DRAFT_496331 [Naematelia encephala]|uniref:Crossover junction endonuclease MUS81 n=1 Tax=Naematelia encephala TaxID=71784 RepID=A0A1Y2B092_9TREE|nr:hypothetical protein BCR39DRAFT_496331 [Naematelia encephala]
MSREKPACGNPLFLTWVEELRDQARERGTKAYESYSKAARSLASCPVKYDRPRELVCLAGIGPKTVGILETKFRKYCLDQGLPIPGESPEKRKVTKTKSQNLDAPGEFFDNGSNPSDSEPELESGPPEPSKKKRKPAAPKRYIPARGSGGYGILLGLILAIDRPDLCTQVFLTKSELIRAAQPYSDSSYEHSEKGTYFTAWSSMKTLVGKGYVYVTGNPHKYCLTEDGYEVGCAIKKLRPELGHIEMGPFIHEPMDAVGKSGPSTTRAPAVKRKSAESVRAVEPRRISGPSGKFEFWYIDATGARTNSLDDAMVRLDPDQFINIRKVEFLASQRNHTFAKQLRMVDTEEQARPTVFGFIVEDGAPPTCSRFDEPDTEETQSVEADDSEVTIAGVSALARTRSVPDSGATQSIDMTSGPSRTHSATADLSLPSRPLTGNRPRAPRLSSHVPAPSPLAEMSPTVSIPNFEPSTAINFAPGTFDIILVLDTREVESKTSRDKFAEALEARGLNIETRALRLGDMCWIARRRDGLGGEEDECVLDYVVERKRLDDLCSSIRDGRYVDQCFRLTNSCISNVFYIVEDWQVGHNMDVSGLQIMTAKSQIQVHNRFFLKETHKLSETIDWLVTMTNVITQRHSGALHVIPTRLLSRSSYSSFQAHLRSTYPDKRYLISFQAYQDLNDKSASKTLREKFARMLMSVKGMSAERVSAVLDEFETPRALWEGMKRRLTDHVDVSGGKRGPDVFFADRIKGEGRRKIGDALSREVSYKCLWVELTSDVESVHGRHYIGMI